MLKNAMKEIKHIIRASCMAFVLLYACTLSTEAAGYANDKSPDAYTAHIKERFEARDWTSVKQLLDEALALYPEDSELNRWAGSYFLQQEEPENARYFLIKATQLDDENAQAKWQLVTLEESRGNLSSAICYVNELLELKPYDQALWKRKIGLYRKKGEHEEADRLLKRLRSIYPNDTTLARDYVNRLEENYLRQRKNGQQETAIRSLEELIQYRKRPEYYADLSKLLLQSGRSEEALSVLSAGIEAYPDNYMLVKKKADILTEKGNGVDAYNLVRGSKSGNDSLRILENQVLLESARRENWKDPYLLYGRIYAAQKSSEALDYLVRTSFSRGYYEDALFYLSEAEKRQGSTPDILYKKYRVYKNLGESRAALRMLEQLVETDGNNGDYTAELAFVRMQEADELMTREQYDEAIAILERLGSLNYDAESKRATYNKLIDCYLKAGEYGRALRSVDSLRLVTGDASLYAGPRAVALDQTGHTEEALAELERQTPDMDLYEEISTRHIKRLLEAGAIRSAHDASKRWLRVNPHSQAALRYAIQTSGTLKLYDEEADFIQEGRSRYPDELFFVLKETSVCYRNQEYDKGMSLVSPLLDSLSGNMELKKAYMAHSEGRVEQLLKEQQTEEALSILGSVLQMDSVSPSMAYTAGIAYEQAGDYRTAYDWYARYNPPVNQLPEYRRKLMAVQRKLYKNRIMTELLAGWYSNGGDANLVHSVSYSRLEKKNVFTAVVDFTIRKNEETDTKNSRLSEGSGLQFKGSWGHVFNSKWSTLLGFSVANRYFPTWSGQAGLFYYFPNDVELGATLGYKHNYNAGKYLSALTDNRSTHMYSLKLTGTLYRDTWRLTGNCDSYLLNKKAYFNINSQVRFYPLNDGETHLLATLGAGTAPEADFIDKMMPGSFDNLNVTFGIGGVYLLSKNISLGLMASYYRFYTQQLNEANPPQTITNHKNLYNLYAQLTFAF